MIKTSEAFDSARSEYIEGYEEKNEYIFPTLSLVAKEFNISLSTLRKKAANEGWYNKRKHHRRSREEYKMRKHSQTLCLIDTRRQMLLQHYSRDIIFVRL